MTHFLSFSTMLYFFPSNCDLDTCYVRVSWASSVGLRLPQVPEFPSVVSYRMSDYFLNEEAKKKRRRERAKQKNVESTQIRLNLRLIIIWTFISSGFLCVSVCPINYSFWMCNEIEHAIFIMLFLEQKNSVDYFQYFGWFFHLYLTYSRIWVSLYFLC